MPNDNKNIYNLSIASNFFYLSLFFGIACRIISIFYHNFWLDELWSSIYSDPSNSLNEVISLTLSDVHPPLYQVLLYYWYKLFGFFELTGRVLSLLFGLVSIWGFYLLTNTIYEKSIAQNATSLFALSGFAIVFCSEVRSYELLLMLSIFSSLFFFRWIFNAKKIDIFAYIVFSFLLIYTHYFGVILLLCHGCTLAYQSITNKNGHLLKQACLVYPLLIILFLPLLPYVFHNAANKSFWINQPSLTYLFLFSMVYFEGPFAPVFLPFIFFGLIKARMSLSKTEFLLFLLAILSILIPYILGFFLNPLITPRNLIIGLPFWLTLCAFTCSFLGKKTYAAFFITNILIAIITTASLPWTKGEQIDGLFNKAETMGVPLYIVNDGHFNTSKYLETKLKMNSNRYPSLEIFVMNDSQFFEKKLWLSCYHTCASFNLNSWIPEGFSKIDSYHGRGVKAFLIEKNTVLDSLNN